MAKQRVVLVIALMAACILHAAASETSTSANSTVDAATTVYGVLQQNNLPRGLLPQGVKSYVLHADGALEVTLRGECNFFVTVAGKQYKFRYDRTVSGIIKSGSITRVNGVRMQVAFAWLGFNQVNRAGDQLRIQLETSTQSFPVSSFAQSPHCN
ncbi:uncharacterized protein LOC133888346 [Phragmites australis]|uniref:uncharacterized protein LOC133888346 n=1 Tax=Phragmites australis TaxID=29695 RepID=UPI002D76F322|nr:uncharacterized protein LOC133888346 [Phragmites australis]